MRGCKWTRRYFSSVVSIVDVSFVFREDISEGLAFLGFCSFIYGLVELFFYKIIYWGGGRVFVWVS